MLFLLNRSREDRPKHAETDSFSYVKTDAFAKTILVHCKTRRDERAIAVQGLIEYFGGDLHAADCVYHQSCNVNFRTKREMPKQFKSVDFAKRRPIGRPKDCDQEEVFEKVCTFLKENDQEQLTTSDLVAKIGEYLSDCKSVVYGNQYPKGVKNIVTFRGENLSDSS